MVRDDVEVHTFQEVPEMLEDQVNSQQLPVESTVSGLCWPQLAREEGNGTPD